MESLASWLVSEGTPPLPRIVVTTNMVLEKGMTVMDAACTEAFAVAYAPCARVGALSTAVACSSSVCGRVAGI